MPTESMPSLATEHARTVLFVDDEPQACKWFSRLFSNEFVIVTAGSVDEALQVLDQRALEIAVLVTDYRMPARDGLALLYAAQRDHRHVVRLLATAYAEKEVAVAAINQGRVMQILEKPFDETRVRVVLREALDIFVQRQREQSLIEGRSAAMRETLGFLAHELNTPLATVLGYMDSLKRRYVPSAIDEPGGLAGFTEKRPGDALTIVETAERRTLYAMSLVSTFVQSARDAYPGAVHTPLQASRLVKALLSDYPFENDERAWVSSDLQGDFELPGPRDLLYLVMCTLTKNAIFALREVSAPRLHITLERAEGDQAAICFTDNGPGIAPAILARLTREPVTTRAEQGGSGMGLLFCRRVVQSMGGTIQIHSDAGHGARVTLLFKPEKILERTNT